MKINEIIKEERPREKLIKDNPLTNVELMAILINSGTKNRNSKDLAQIVINIFSTFPEIKDITFNQLLSIKGIGPAKASTVLAALEIGKRVYTSRNIDTIYIKKPRDVLEYFGNNLLNLKQEHFYAIFLDSKKRIITCKLIFIGTLNMSVVHPRELFKEAFLNSASSIICVHNHPSGDTNPSSPDIELTFRLKEISKLMGIPINDHVIIGNRNYFSFRRLSVLI